MGLIEENELEEHIDDEDIYYCTRCLALFEWECVCMDDDED
jgi:hypothetical protein